MAFLLKSTPYLAILLLVLHKIHAMEQPVAMSHHSYHEFDAGDADEPERRSKRATVLAFTASQAKEIVDMHNRFRGMVRPEAANMEFMKWDNDLARMAMRYSQRCHWGHGHVINVSPYSSVGQNLWIQGLSNRNTVPTFSNAINAWHNEVRNYNFATHECQAPHQCGHYTQLVWGETTSVGCGLAYCPRVSNWTHAESWIMTCYYGPAGNYVGVRPYVSGPSCTQCQSEVGQCYNNMCRLCSDHNEKCDCRQQCINCGTVDTYSCTCICQDGWYGPDCGKFCNETHPYCNVNPGWPGPKFCGQHPMIPKHCPKMCGLCVDPDPTFVCNPISAEPTAIFPGARGTAAPPVNPGNPNPTLGPGRPPQRPQGTVIPLPRNTFPPTNPPRFPRTNPPRFPRTNAPRFPPTNPPRFPRTNAPRFPPTNPPRFPPTNPPMQPPMKPPVRPPFNPPMRPPVNPPVNPRPPFNPGFNPFPTNPPTGPRFPVTAVDCKIRCQNGGIQDIVTCRCTCTPRFTGQYCQHDVTQIQNGAMLRLVGDIRDWGMMEYDIHQAIEQSVDMFCNSNVAQCCPGVQATPQVAQFNFLDMTNVLTGTGFPEVDAFQTESYWTLLVATEPTAPQLCTEAQAGGAGGAAVEPALLMRKTHQRRSRDTSSSVESGEEGGAGGPAPTYVPQPIMLNALDQNIAAINTVLQMYNVRLAEVQRAKPLTGAAVLSSTQPMVVIIVSLTVFIANMFAL